MADANAGQSKGSQAGKQGRQAGKTGLAITCAAPQQQSQDEREGTEKEVQRVMH